MLSRGPGDRSAGGAKSLPNRRPTKSKGSVVDYAMKIGRSLPSHEELGGWVTDVRVPKKNGENELGLLSRIL